VPLTPKEPRCSRPLLSGASFECRSHVSHPRGVVQRTYHEGSHNFFAAPSHYPTITLSSQPTFVVFIFPSRSSHLRQLVSTTSHTRRHSTAVAHQTHSIGLGTMEPHLQRLTRPCRLHDVWQHVSCHAPCSTQPTCHHGTFSPVTHKVTPTLRTCSVLCWSLRSSLADQPSYKDFSLQFLFLSFSLFFPSPISPPLNTAALTT